MLTHNIVWACGIVTIRYPKLEIRLGNCPVAKLSRDGPVDQLAPVAPDSIDEIQTPCRLMSQRLEKRPIASRIVAAIIDDCGALNREALLAPPNARKSGNRRLNVSSGNALEDGRGNRPHCVG